MVFGQLRFLILIIAFSLAQIVDTFAQVDSVVDTSIIDNTKELSEEDLKIKSAYPVPKRALILSIVPGLGQVYNKKFWKVPIVIGGIGFSTYSLIQRKKRFNQLNTAYRARIDDDPTTNDNVFPYSNEGLWRLRQAADRDVQRYYIFTGIVYSLSIIDAFVDAHLSHFEVSDDLSLKVVPSTMDGAGLGFSGVLRF